MRTDWIIMSKEFEDPSSLGPKKKEEKGRGGRLFISKRELRNTVHVYTDESIFNVK